MPAAHLWPWEKIQVGPDYGGGAVSELQLNSSQASSPWTNNPVLVQLLGLSPVLAISTTLVNGLGLGISTALVMLLSSVTVSTLRTKINQRWRFTWYLLITASYTTILDSLLQWFYSPLHRELGIYIPLICCNFAVLIRLEVHAINHHWRSALKDAALTGSGFIVAIVALSSLRELIGRGTLLADWQLLLPVSQATAVISKGSNTTEYFDFALLLPAAFILLGLLIAGKNLIDCKLNENAPVTAREIEPIKRARVTGGL
ncbi:MAG: electron transport complex subunit RsxE [Gammaproteobacteria bacterium]|nr:electron transport complex subunit RsxE [Gammaproteobacteria bacterium]